MSANSPVAAADCTDVKRPLNVISRSAAYHPAALSLSRFLCFLFVFAACFNHQEQERDEGKQAAAR